MFGGILCVILFICIAMLWNEGMWSNAISFVNVLFAAIVATNYWEPLATYIDEKAPSFTYFWDFFSLWAIFSLTYLISRSVFTDRLSSYRVRFKMPVEATGRVIFAFLTAWLLVCFTTFSMHTAPLAKSPFRGSFYSDGATKNFFGLGPDLMWLKFAHSRSSGALSRSDPPGSESKRIFDPNRDFMARYAERRNKLEQQEGLRVRP